MVYHSFGVNFECLILSKRENAGNPLLFSMLDKEMQRKNWCCHTIQEIPVAEGDEALYVLIVGSVNTRD